MSIGVQKDKRNYIILLTQSQASKTWMWHEAQQSQIGTENMNCSEIGVWGALGWDRES